MSLRKLLGQQPLHCIFVQICSRNSLFADDIAPQSLTKLIVPNAVDVRFCYPIVSDQNVLKLRGEDFLSKLGDHEVIRSSDNVKAVTATVSLVAHSD